MKQITWSPDWCNCSVIYEYDDTLPTEQITTFTGVGINKKCPAHRNITDPQELYTILHEETTIKERSRQAIVDSLPDPLVTIDRSNGTRLQNPEKVDIIFDFQGTNPRTRNVNVSFKVLEDSSRLTTQTRTNFKTTIRNRITQDGTLNPTRQTRISIYDNDDPTREVLNR